MCFEDFLPDFKVSKEGKEEILEAYAREVWRMMDRCRREGKDPRAFGFDKRICAVVDPCNVMNEEAIGHWLEFARQDLYPTIASLHPYFACLDGGKKSA